MNEPLDQSDEHIRWRPLLVFPAGALLLFGAASICTAWVQHREMGSFGDDHTIARTDVGGVQVGTVETRLIELEDRALRIEAERKAQLDQYSWVDRDNGVIRVPVEKGMQWVVEGRR
jgi:hypothetical protein